MLPSCPQPVRANGVNSYYWAEWIQSAQVKLSVKLDTCLMVSRTTASLLMEKALQGVVSEVQRIGLNGKLRLYAHWMTQASWKDPGLQHRQHPKPTAESPSVFMRIGTSEAYLGAA